MKHLNIIIKYIVPMMFVSVMPLGALAVNDVQSTGDTDFQLNTADTSVLTTITVSSGGQATFFDVPTNYIDITLDNSSDLTFNVATPNRFFKITKQSGSNSFTVSPSCPTNSVTLKGTGAQVVLRLQVFTTNTCPHGGGGGGGGGYTPTPTPFPTASPFATPTPAPIAGPTPTPLPGQPSCANPSYFTPVILTVFARNLTQGVSGKDVTAVQQVLAADRSVYPEGLVNGSFGAATAGAVKRFQAKYGLPQTGVVDRQTRIQLAAIAKTIRIPICLQIAKGPPPKIRVGSFLRIRLQ